MSSDDSGSQRRRGDEPPPPPEFLAHVDTQFGQVKASVYMSYGHLGVDCEAVTRQAFSQTLEVWRPPHPISFTRKAAFDLAEASKGRKATKALANASIEKALELVVSPSTRATLRAIDLLPLKMRIAFLCTDIFRLPPADVAAILGTKSYRVNLHQARKKLRDAGFDLDGLADEIHRLP
jgi:hypothetical protein